MNDISDLCSCEFIKIPITWVATKTYEISFDGWNPESLDENDPSLSSLLTFMKKCLKSFIEIYDRDYVFSQPSLVYKSHNKIFSFKIGTLEKKEYERRINEKD